MHVYTYRRLSSFNCLTILRPIRRLAKLMRQISSARDVVQVTQLKLFRPTMFTHVFPILDDMTLY